MSPQTATPYDMAAARLGPVGKLLSGSKVARPGREVVWNANVCTKRHGKIWFGDIDVGASQEHLDALAEDLDEPVFVLREHDARFDNEEKPLFGNAVATFGEER